MFFPTFTDDPVLIFASDDDRQPRLNLLISRRYFDITGRQRQSVLGLLAARIKKMGICHLTRSGSKHFDLFNLLPIHRKISVFQ